MTEVTYPDPPAELVSSWLLTFPVLQNRPELVERLKHSRYLRRKVFHFLNDISNASHIPDPRTAIHVIELLYREKRARIKEWVTLEEEDRRVYNELIGALRNYTISMMKRCRPTTKAIRFRKLDVAWIPRNNHRDNHDPLVGAGDGS